MKALELAATITTLGDITILTDGNDGTVYRHGVEIGGCHREELGIYESVDDDTSGTMSPDKMVWVVMIWDSAVVSPPYLSLALIAGWVGDQYLAGLGLGQEF